MKQKKDIIESHKIKLCDLMRQIDLLRAEYKTTKCPRKALIIANEVKRLKYIHRHEVMKRAS